MFSIAISSRLQVLALAAATLFGARPALCSDAVVDSVEITPELLTNGAPCIFTVALHDEASIVTGEWQGHPVAFFSSTNHRTWFALAGVDVEVKPGKYPLTIEVDLKDGTRRILQQEIPVEEAPYEKVPLSVPDKFVEPDAAALKKIASDMIGKDRAFANSASKPLWSGNFLPPLRRAPESDSFGNQRIFNGKLSSVHRGLDYRAKPGTPVAAINSGRVVLARPLYYEGGCVIVDHGMGLMSLYMHLSKIEVSGGSRVRVTGPHLHLGLRWQGSYLDAAKLFQLHMPQTY
jgi:murein DD-endopeptidase MepM/ murein hydrolase activator NlpD